MRIFNLRKRLLSKLYKYYCYNFRDIDISICKTMQTERYFFEIFFDYIRFFRIRKSNFKIPITNSVSIDYCNFYRWNKFSSYFYHNQFTNFPENRHWNLQSYTIRSHPITFILMVSEFWRKIPQSL